jgi:sterol desaturase/sphingolipid hydroxylase (fatty acid hydroxylase superfamily)
MQDNLIALAVPVFFVAILIEALVNWRRKLGAYRLHDSLSNLSGGVGSEILGGFTALLGLFIYTYVQEHFAILKISPRSWVAWLVLLFALDFCYYLYHWASHRVNFLWATHAVHHQSEEYNLSVALRQSWLTKLTSWVFYIPLALLGFPLVMYLTVYSINLLYQFWIHTRAIGTLGFLESFLNTPSHHRVHHGIEPRYIDKNHAGMFIIWDRLFGTFTKEQNEPVYGTVKPLSTFDPVWANVVELARLWEMSRRTRRFVDKIKVWLMPPEWRPADLGGVVTVPDITRAQQRKYVVRPALAVSVYATVSFALVLLASVYFLWIRAHLPIGLALVYVAEGIFGLYTVAALTEGKAHARPLELVRLISVAGLVFLVPVPMPFAAALLVATGGSLLGLLYLQLRVNEAPQIDVAEPGGI